MNGDSNVKDVAELAQKGFAIKIDEDVHTPLNVHRVYDDPRPKTLVLRSLTGLVDYLRENIDL